MDATLAEYLESQDHLVREAALALPHQFSQCTYSRGSLRQAVYLCLTCPEARGLCSACSIACHTDHEQVELFPKRNFRCDCPTSAIAHSCTLHKTLEDENLSNIYGQNFQGLFCRCGRPYNPATERETMIQCLACEDWFHESCCNLRERLSSREPSPNITPSDSNHVEDSDNVSETSSGLPPPFISGEEYESFVCGACASSIQTLRKYAGTRGVMMVLRDNIHEPWRRVNGDVHTPEDSITVHEEIGPSEIRKKRPLSPSASEPQHTKRSRGQSSESSPHTPCLAPAPNIAAQKIYSNGITTALDPNISLGTGDVFLCEGFRQRWCCCSACLPSLKEHPYLLQEEETYEPPDDPDSGLSLEELGIRALERIPRDRAIDGIHAFNEMKDDLVKFLRPFAQSGKVVNESDVREFFASKREAADEKR